MLKAELHVHSNFSDGKDSVKKILQVAIEKGINVISITDHDTINGSLEALEIVRDEHLPITVIPGVEISACEGHVLAYGILKDIDPGISIKETCRIVRKLGGLSFLAHPFDFMRKGCRDLKCFKFVDGIEVFNAKNPFNPIVKFLAKRYSKPGIAGALFTLGPIDSPVVGSRTNSKTSIAVK